MCLPQSTFTLLWVPKRKWRAGHRLSCVPLSRGVSGLVSARPLGKALVGLCSKVDGGEKDE